ncbi:hypothetical protein JOJ86_004974 [Rhodococcus percolatus]|nr:hypothetical protein [Rhodococcus opacus]MBP2207248.1 hypothetical protein [Rhodococcus opacus]
MKPVLVTTPVGITSPSTGRRSTRCCGGTPHDLAVCPRSVGRSPAPGMDVRVYSASGHVVVQPILLGWLRRPIIRNLRGVPRLPIPHRSRSERPRSGCFPRTRYRGWPAPEGRVPDVALTRTASQTPWLIRTA